MKLERTGLFLVFALLVVSLLLPLFLRVGEGAPITPRSESYTHLLLADELIAPSYTFSDVAPTPYTLLLSGMTVLDVPWLLPGLLSVLLVVLLYYFLLRLMRRKLAVTLSLLVFVLTPSLSVLGTSHSQALLCMVLLLGVALLLPKHPMTACLLLALSILTSPVLGVVVAAYFLFKYAKKRVALWITLAFALSFLWFFFVVPPELPNFGFSNIIFELGIPDGISIFLIIMAAYGILIPMKRITRLELGAKTLALFGLTFLLQPLLPLTVILLSVLAGHGILHLMKVKWDLELLRQALLVLVFCLGLFLFIVTIRDRVDDQPTADFANSMTYLRDQHRQGAVLSAPRYAPMIEYFSKRRATLPADNLFLSRNAAELYDFLESTGSSHILVTEEMLDTMFTRSDEGMLFLLQNAQRFVLVYETETTQLWYYIPRRG